jgi:hypothetical protein
MPTDQWREAALTARSLVSRARLTTCEPVLIEVLTGVSSRGAMLRRGVAEMVRSIVSDPAITVVPLSRTLFLRALDLFSDRDDKSYSMTDCISMCVMRDQGINQALTNDHHFNQEGFEALFGARP